MTRGLGNFTFRLVGLRSNSSIGLRRARARHGAAIGDRRFARPDGILGDIDDHDVGRAELEQSAVVSANPGRDLRDQLLVVSRVRDHRQARLDLVEHVTGGVMRGVGLVDRRHADDGRHAHFHRLEIGRVRLHFGHEHVHAFGEFDRAFLRPPVTGPDE